MKRSNEHGFTLLEAIVSLVLAASGIALMFQSITGAAKIQAATIELQQTRMVAHSIFAKINPETQNSSGILNGIAWTLTAEPIARNSQGIELIRIRIVTSGASGRQVVLVSETLRQNL
ncbi:MAG: prepilin-type N-terminal cleavage/methylation domain-containing protein [Robiginitomaculum sp.]|nr:prepilin-type N-terminal cleavage/methylation domain-containing protein [Robiginitomaculum sp.]